VVGIKKILMAVWHQPNINENSNWHKYLLP